MARTASCLFFSLIAGQWVPAEGAERAGDTTALPTEGNETIFTGLHARYIVTVEAAGARCAVPADFDGDGDMDIVSVSSNDNTVAWYQRLADGTYGPKKMISRASNGARIVTTGDIDQDGKIDVIVASYYDHTVGWFKNEGGKFGPMRMVTRSANSAQGVSVADIDNDGDLDILSASSGDNTVAWYENLGGGNFCEVKNVVDSQSMGIRTVVAADMDEDGDLDLMVASKDDSRVTFYKNDGSMGFEKIVIDDKATGSYSLVVADVDKDGHLDAAGAANMEGVDVSGEGEGGKINFYRGDGKGGFVKIGVTGPDDYDWFTLSVWAGDLDGDGDVDIASASFALLHQGGISWYENLDGKGDTWLRHKFFTTPTKKTGHYVFGADMDGDGDNDLIAVTNGDDKVQILYAHTPCDNSKTHPREECCTSDQYWNGSHCSSCPLSTFLDKSTGWAVCSPCVTTCPRPGLSKLPNSCWSIEACTDLEADMARCDCGQNHFLDKDLGTCKKCADGMITLYDRTRKSSDHNMVARKFLDQTTYMISDYQWQGFESSRCEIPVCDPAHIFNMSTKVCTPCPAETYSPGGAVLQCSICTAGYFCPEKTSMPISCQAGFFSSFGQAACTQSPKGFVSPVGGLAAPRPCLAGSYSDNVGMQQCKACPWGKYAIGSVNGTDSCTDCPAGTTTAIVGAKSLRECVCKKGTFHYCRGNSCSTNVTNPLDAFFCQACPAGALCEGPPESPEAMILGEELHRPPTVPQGFMSIGTSVYRCGADGKACPGAFMFSEVDNMCNHGGAGIACADCADEHYWLSNKCEKCEGGSLIGLVLFGLVLIFAAGLFIYHWNEKAAKVEAIESVLASVTIGVTVSFMQTLGFFSQMRFSWPVEFQFCMDIMNLFIFDLRILRLGCVFTESLALKATPSLLMPLFAVAVFLVWYPLSVILNKLSGGRFKVFNMDAVYNALGMVLQVFYMSIVLTVAKAFDCYSSPNSRRTLRMSPSNVCWEGSHIPLLIISAIAGVVYVIGFFVFLTYLIIQAPVKIVEKSFSMRYKFVFFKYNPTVYWFGVPLMVRSMAISLVSVISPDDGYMQFLLMLFILVVFGFWHLMYLPYADRYANNLETGELGILIIMLGFGSWFMTRDDGTSNVDENPDMARVLSVVLICLLVVCILMVVSVFVYAMHQAANPIKAQRALHQYLEPMLANIHATGMILSEIDSDHLLKLLSHATYIDINCLLSIVDYITVEVGGQQPDSWLRARLPRVATEMKRNSTKDDLNAKAVLVRSASKLFNVNESEIESKVSRSPGISENSWGKPPIPDPSLADKNQKVEEFTL